MDRKLIRAMLYLYRSLFLIAPLLMFHRTSELFEFNKMLFIYLVTGAIGAVWLSRMIVHKRIILKNTLFSPVLLAFFASQVLSTIFSIDRSTSIFGYYGRFNGGLLSIASYVLLYMAFTSNFKGDQLKSAVRTLIHSSIIGSVLVLLWGLPSKFGYDPSCLLFTGTFDVGCWTEQFKPTIRVFSTLGQPNWMGAYLAVNFFFGLYYFLISFRKKSTSYMYAAYLLFLMIMLLFTRSRSSLVAVDMGLLLVAAYFVVHYGKNLLKAKYRAPIGIFVGVLIVAILIAKTGVASIDRYITFNMGSNQSKESTAPATPEDENLLITDSFAIRKIVWQGGYSLGLTYPLFGTGVETFAYSYNFVRPVAHNNTSEWDYVYNKAHNEFVNYFATTGVVGLGTYLVFLGVVLSQVIHLFKRSSHLEFEERMLLLACFAGFITIIVTNFFGFSITVTNVYLYLLPAFIISLTDKKLSNENTSDQSAHYAISKEQKRMLVLPAVVMAAVFLMVINYWRADMHYAKGDGLASVQDYNGALVELYRAYNLRSEHVYADKISNVLAQVALLQAATKGETTCVSHKNELKECTELVEDYMQTALHGSPKNPYYYRTASRNSILLYQATGDEMYYEKAVDAVQTARMLAPTDPRYPYTLALFHLAKYENTKNPTAKDTQLFGNQAIPLVDFSLQLKPDYRDAYYAKVLILKQLKQAAEAKQLIEMYLEKYNSTDEQFLEELKSL